MKYRYYAFILFTGSLGFFAHQWFHQQQIEAVKIGASIELDNWCKRLVEQYNSREFLSHDEYIQGLVVQYCNDSTAAKLKIESTSQSKFPDKRAESICATFVTDYNSGAFQEDEDYIGAIVDTRCPENYKRRLNH